MGLHGLLQDSFTLLTYSVPTPMLLSLSFFFLVLWGGVRLSPLGTSATNWPIVPDPDGRWWLWRSRWSENWQEKPKYSENTCPSVTSSTTNPTWSDVDLNPGRRGGKPATNRLSYGAAFMLLQLPLSNQEPKKSFGRLPWKNILDDVQYVISGLQADSLMARRLRGVLPFLREGKWAKNLKIQDHEIHEMKLV
jgi:hypothetical protein